MFETIRNAFKIKEVRQKIFMTILFVIIYRLGCYIPVPGFNGITIDASAGYGLTSVLDAITGSALSNGTIFALGISPYINASIIMQLLTVALPPLERLSKKGEEGKKTINFITRIVTLVLAIVSALGIVLGLGGESAVNVNFLTELYEMPVWAVYSFIIVVLVAGSMLCMWIGERITEYGVSNGISMIIFVGIISTAGQAMIKTIVGQNWVELGVFLVSIVLIFAFIVWVDGAERKIKVQYAKQVKGNKLYGGQSTVIPIKVNGSGVMPLIFAFSILSFPSMLISTFWADAATTEGTFAYWWTKYLGTGTVVYTIFLALLILGFAYFYSQIQFNPVEISRNIQGNGGFIPGIRPGRETSEYLHKVISRITLWGAVFLAFIALVPSLLFMIPSWIGIASTDTQLINSFSATGMLITVSVALEFNRTLENQILMRHYKGFLK